jgi:hypothetical protein
LLAPPGGSSSACRNARQPARKFLPAKPRERAAPSAQRGFPRWPVLIQIPLGSGIRPGLRRGLRHSRRPDRSRPTALVDRMGVGGDHLRDGPLRPAGRSQPHALAAAHASGYPRMRRLTCIRAASRWRQNRRSAERPGPPLASSRPGRAHGWPAPEGFRRSRRCRGGQAPGSHCPPSR